MERTEAWAHFLEAIQSNYRPTPNDGLSHFIRKLQEPTGNNRKSEVPPDSRKLAHPAK